MFERKLYYSYVTTGESVKSEQEKIMKEQEKQEKKVKGKQESRARKLMRALKIVGRAFATAGERIKPVDLFKPSGRGLNVFGTSRKGGVSLFEPAPFPSLFSAPLFEDEVLVSRRRRRRRR